MIPHSSTTFSWEGNLPCCWTLPLSHQDPWGHPRGTVPISISERGTRGHSWSPWPGFCSSQLHAQVTYSHHHQSFRATQSLTRLYSNDKIFFNQVSPACLSVYLSIYAFIYPSIHPSIIHVFCCLLPKGYKFQKKSWKLQMCRGYTRQTVWIWSSCSQSLIYNLMVIATSDLT